MSDVGTAETIEQAIPPVVPVLSSPVPSTVTTSVTNGPPESPTTITTTTPAVQTDQTTIHSVIYGLLAVALLCISGVIYLAAVHVPVPDFLTIVGGGAITGLAAMLAHTGSSN